MRGARGLLISITGGNDLTLYEVDEAASRIRQEVDEEANIILGATFEPALDGVVRVSVVATGIDQAVISQIEPVTVQPRAETTPRLRAPIAAQVRAAAPPPAQIEAANDIEIQQVAAGSSAFPEPIEPRHESEEAAAHFIPPASEQPIARAVRMPQIEDLPQLAQNQLRAMREAQSGAPPAPETRRRSLLQELTAVGITRHDDEPTPKAAAPTLPAAPPLRPHAIPPAQSDFGRGQPPRPQSPPAPPGAPGPPRPPTP